MYAALKKIKGSIRGFAAWVQRKKYICRKSKGFFLYRVVIWTSPYANALEKVNIVSVTVFARTPKNFSYMIIYVYMHLTVEYGNMCVLLYSTQIRSFAAWLISTSMDSCIFTSADMFAPQSPRMGEELLWPNSKKIFQRQI